MQALVALYFAFTTLSTVGFGDFHPRSNVERIIGAALMVFGVAILSIIITQFNEMLNEIKEFNAHMDDDT